MKIIKKFPQSGQKEVALIEHEKYGKCIYKIIKYEQGYERAERECSWQKQTDSKYFPKNLDFFKQNDKFEIFEEYIDAPTLEECKSKFFKNEKLIILFLNEMITGLITLWKDENVHRDLKPANIMIRNEYNPVILDLGITKFATLSSLTSPDFIPRTDCYASPEQLNNNRALLNHKMDQFSLGIIIAELYIGRHPFLPKGEPFNVAKIVKNIKDGTYYLDEDLSIEFKGIITKLLKIKQRERFRRPIDIKEYINKNWGDII